MKTSDQTTSSFRRRLLLSFLTPSLPQKKPPPPPETSPLLLFKTKQGNHARRKRNQFLQGNFAPVEEELHERGLQAFRGANSSSSASSASASAAPVPLPRALDGVFARVGPNPGLPPSRFSGDYHWFDGSGHVHAVRVRNSGSEISYCNRWVRTSRLAQERRAGVPLFTNFGDYRGWFGALHLLVGGARRLLRAKDSSDGDGTANTALVFHARRLLALHEGDLPYALRVACDGVVETVGRLREFSSSSGREKEKKKSDEDKETTTAKTTMSHPFTAHPKIDPATGELFGIGYNVEAKPYLYYFGLDGEGALKFDVPIDTPVSLSFFVFLVFWRGC